MTAPAARTTDSPRAILIAVAILVSLYLPLALWIVSGLQGSIATSWMNIYWPGDYHDWRSALAFIRQLRVPIPPVIALAEIADARLTGNVRFMAETAYRASLVIAFMLPLLVSARSIARAIVACVASLICLYSASLIHQGNPQTYDIYVPMFILLFVGSLQAAISNRIGRHWQFVFAALAGFWLSMADLTRPFMWLPSLFAVVAACIRLRDRPRTQLVAFLVAPLLLGGAWHAHQALAYKRVSWSDHSGFNLLGAWEKEVYGRTPLVPEPDNAPLAPNRGLNLNTQAHQENSDRLSAALTHYIATHPAEAATHVYQREKEFLFTIKTMLGGHHVRNWIIQFYRPLVRLMAVVMILSLLALAWSLAVKHGVRLALISAPEHILLVMTAIIVFEYSTVDAGEEARFLVSSLPLLVTVLCSAGAGFRQTGVWPRSPRWFKQILSA